MNQSIEQTNKSRVLESFLDSTNKCMLSGAPIEYRTQTKQCPDLPKQTKNITYVFEDLGGDIGEDTVGGRKDKGDKEDVEKLHHGGDWFRN